MNTRRCHLILFIVTAAATASLRADFSGDYSAGTPTSYNLVNGTTTEIGQWDAFFSSAMSSGFVDTSATPGSITLSVTGQGGFGPSPGDSASLAFSYTFTTSGNVSFSYSIGSAGGSFSVTLDSETQTAIGSGYNFDVLSGQTLSINLIAVGTPGSNMMIPDGMGGFISSPTPGFPSTETVTLSNFIGPPAIPEPASFALAGSLSALAFATLRRRRV